MAVRKTELKLPFNFTASELGQSVEESNFVLISYLTSPLPMNSRNDYVLFVLNNVDVYKYSWKVQINGEELKLEKTDIGIFNYRPEKLGDMKINVDLLDSHENIIKTLSLFQRIIKLDESAEKLFFEGISEYLNVPAKIGAIGGHTPTTRELINDLKEYIFAAAPSPPLVTNPTLNIPTNMLAAIVYREVLNRPKEFEFNRPVLIDTLVRSNELEDAAEELNGEPLSSLSKQIDNSLGVCQIQPQTLAMILNKPNVNQSYIAWREKPQKKEKRKEVDAAILKDYNGLSDEIKIDLFNLLRFPKSNIKMCEYLLSYLKNRNNTRWPTSDQNQLLENEHGLKIIATEYNIGAIDTPADKAKSTNYGNSVFKLMNAPFIALHFIKLVLLKGRVLNKQTKEPIKNARIDLYKTYVKVTKDDLKGYDKPSTAAPSNIIMILQKGDYPVLEKKNNHPDNNTDYLKILHAGKEVWICSRWKDGNDKTQRSALLYDKLIKEGISKTDTSGQYMIKLKELHYYKIRVISKNYFDSESDRILPPSNNVVIEMEPASDNVLEAYIISRISNFKGFSYILKEARYPYELPNVSSDRCPLSPPKQNNCCTFVEGLLVKAWKDALGSDYSWSNDKHDKMMIKGTDHYSPITAAAESSMILEIDSNELPPSWTLVQVWRTQWTGGHTFIIVDVHQETNRILTLESNDSFEMNGPGFRMLGHIDKYVDLSPGQDWWKEEKLWDWEKFKNEYPFRKMGRLKIYDLKFVK